MRAYAALLAVAGGAFLMWAAFTGVSLPWYGAPLTQAQAASAFHVAPPLTWNGWKSQ